MSSDADGSSEAPVTLGGNPAKASDASGPHASDSSAQHQITAFWDLVAPGCDSPDNVARPKTPEYAIWLHALRRLLPEPPTRVLDVGREQALSPA